MKNIMKNRNRYLPDWLQETNINSTMKNEIKIQITEYKKVLGLSGWISIKLPYDTGGMKRQEIKELEYSISKFIELELGIVVQHFEREDSRDCCIIRVDEKVDLGKYRLNGWYYKSVFKK